MFVQFRFIFQSSQHREPFWHGTFHFGNAVTYREYLHCGMDMLSSPLYADRDAKRISWMEIAMFIENEDVTNTEKNELY